LNRLQPFFKSVNFDLVEKKQVIPPFRPQLVSNPTHPPSWLPDGLFSDQKSQFG
jgi:hypothetical protein